MATSIASPVAFDPERYRAFIRDIGDIDRHGMTIICLIYLVGTQQYFERRRSSRFSGQISGCRGFFLVHAGSDHDACQFQAESLA
jgi:hypothetical protein